MATVPGKPWKIYLVSVEAGSPQELTAENRCEGDPSWSADGNSLVFGEMPWIVGTSRLAPIHLLDLKTNQVSTLPGSEGLCSPRWSPDGRYIVAQSADSLKLKLFDFKAQKWVELVKTKLNLRYQNWSRDGKYVYFDTLYGETDRLCIAYGLATANSSG